jgi:hypothetical protein
MANKLLMIIVELLVMILRRMEPENYGAFAFKLNGIEKRYLKMVGDERVEDEKVEDG